MANPIVEPEGRREATGRIVPISPLTAGVSQLILSRSIRQGLDACGDILPDVLPDEVRREHQLCRVGFAYENIHFPEGPEALELAKMGVLPEGMYRNRTFAEPSVDMGDTPLHKQDVLFDPQTAGGLLIAVDPADAQALLEELKPAVPSAQRIGVMEAYQGGKRIFLR